MIGEPIPPRTLRQGFDVDAHLDRLATQGFTIVEDYMDLDQLARFRDAIAPWLGAYRGRNSFEGRATERVYTLVGRGAVFEEIAADARLLAILDRLLSPNYLLSADHAICVHPGEAAQPLHFDDSFYPLPRPRSAISISVIGAIDAFTPENGATVLYPGSHLWTLERCQALQAAIVRGETTADAAARIQLIMPAGAICVFQGTLLHGAGANSAKTSRLAFTNQYCEPWARPQENFYLGIPKAAVRDMRHEMQVLLGYALRGSNDFMGHVGGYHPAKALDPAWVRPVLRDASRFG